jgi:hypothetical protein
MHGNYFEKKSVKEKMATFLYRLRISDNRLDELSNEVVTKLYWSLKKCVIFNQIVDYGGEHDIVI